MLLALSGGVDSSVVAALLIKAVGKQLECVHVNHGLMRKGEETGHRGLPQPAGRNLTYVDAVDRFLDKAGRRVRPGDKRKVIGAGFVRVFEEEAASWRASALPGPGHDIS